MVKELLTRLGLVSTDSLRGKAIAGIMWVGSGRILGQIVLTGGNIALARMLLPQIWGEFAIVNFVVSAVGTVASLALEPLIVQSKQELDQLELDSLMWTKIMVGVVDVLLLLAIAPLVSNYYTGVLGNNTIFLLLVLGGTLLFANVRSVSNALLERRLEYKKLMLVEAMELLVIQLVSIYLVWSDWGLAGLVWGNVVGKAVGSLAIVKVANWKWSGGWKGDIVKQNLMWGVKYQLTTWIGFVSAALIPVLVGKVMGAEQVGILMWALSISLGIKIFADVVARVIFSVSARLQEDKIRLKKLTIKGTGAALVVTAPLAFVFFVFGEVMVARLYGEQWLPGLLVLRLFLIQAVLSVVEVVGVRIWLGIGRLNEVLVLNLVVALINWSVTLVLIFSIGSLAVPVAGIVASIIVLMWMARWIWHE